MILDILVFILVFIIIPLAFLALSVPKIVSVTVGSPSSTHSAPRRSALLKPGQELRTSPDPSVKTLWDVLLFAHAKFPSSQHLLGSRKLIKTVKETKIIKKVVGGKEIETEKEWSFSELGPYNWLSIDDVLKLSKNLGAGLVSLGLKPGDKATIFHSTSKEWLTFSYACYSQSLTITTAYDSLGVEALAYSLNEAEVTTLLTQQDLMGIIKRIGDSVPTLKNVIYSGEVDPAELESIKVANPSLSFYSLTELEELGKSNPTPPNPPKPEDLACIMYTSGSTGNPKGVMITHASMVAAIGGACDSLEACSGLLAETGNYYLAYLPLAHVLEFLIENLCVFKGVALGYGGVRTLTDGSVRGCKGDIKELRPTLMAGVPAVWETIRKGIQTQLKQASPLQRYIFDSALNLKKLLVSLNLPHNFMDKIVFKKISDGTGGRLRAAISGGAPVASQTQEFLSMVLCPLIQGYGMTECCGMMTCQLTTDIGTYASVGAPSTAAEIKLVACNNYDPNPAPGSNIPPRGELWVRGGIVMSGYYKQPQTTRENLTEDGWLMSGDIAEFSPDGSIKIIDRKKNLVKLAHGEYVALEKLEAQYKTSSYVANMCIHADSLQSHIIGLVVCDPKELSSLQSELGLDSNDLSNDKLISTIQKDFLECARNAEFKGAEVLKSFAIVGEEWTAENGMLTAAQKVNVGLQVD